MRSVSSTAASAARCSADPARACATTCYQASQSPGNGGLPSGSQAQSDTSQPSRRAAAWSNVSAWIGSSVSIGVLRFASSPPKTLLLRRPPGRGGAPSPSRVRSRPRRLRRPTARRARSTRARPYGPGPRSGAAARIGAAAAQSPAVARGAAGRASPTGRPRRRPPRGQPPLPNVPRRRAGRCAARRRGLEALSPSRSQQGSRSHPAFRLSMSWSVFMLAPPSATVLPCPMARTCGCGAAPWVRGMPHAPRRIRAGQNGRLCLGYRVTS